MFTLKSPKRSFTLFLFLFAFMLVAASLTITEKVRSDLKDNINLRLVSFDSGYARSPPNFKSFLESFGGFLQYQIKSFLGPKRFEKININIKFEDYQLLLKERQKALDNSMLSNASFVPATIQFQGRTLNAELRLKGDLKDHWSSKRRFSLRVKLKSKGSIKNYKVFSLHQPRQRQHPYDQIFHDVHRASGGIGAFHDYAHIYVNGQNWGIMNIEEHVTKQLIEKHGRKSTILFRFGNEEKSYYKRTTTQKIARASNFLSDPLLHLKLYQSKKTLKSAQSRNYVSYVIHHRLKDNSEYLYDVDKFSKLLILSEIWNNRHVLSYMNSRFYFNPYSLKIEPISGDQGSFKSWEKGRGGSAFSGLNYKLYREVVKTKQFDDNFIQNHNMAFEAFENLEDFSESYEKFFPLHHKIKTSLIERNKQVIKDDLMKVKKKFIANAEKSTPRYAHSNITKEQSHDIKSHIMAFHEIDGTIKIFKLFNHPIEVLNIKNKKRTIGNFTPIMMKSEHFHPHKPDLVLKTDQVGINDGKITIETIMEGVKKRFVIPYSLIPEDKLKNPFTDLPQAQHEMFEKINKNTWLIKKGRWEIRQPLMVDGNVKIEPGAQLSFDSDALMLVKGSLSAQGQKNDKIIMKPIKESWRGLFVYGNKMDSYVLLEHAEIHNTDFFKFGVLSLTGGVNIYRAKTHIKETKLIGTIAEDALNIIESNYVLNDSVIVGARSDGFDSDFSNGVIRNFVGSNIGGDALDFSGGDSQIYGAKINSVVDKAISAGECSKLKVDVAAFEDVGVGIASKDGSLVKATNINVTRATLSSAMVYQKKDFYPFAIMSINGINAYDTPGFFVQDGSRLVIDGDEIATRRIDTQQLYNNTIMKK